MLEPNSPTNLPDIVVGNDNHQPVGFYDDKLVIWVSL